MARLNALNQCAAGFEIGNVEGFEENTVGEIGGFLLEFGETFGAAAEVGGYCDTSGADEVLADFRAKATDAAGDQRNTLTHAFLVDLRWLCCSAIDAALRSLNAQSEHKMVEAGLT
jgi:hypothetical protein